MIRIKNCGLRTPADIEQAARTGAHFIGFVHHAASPRHLPLPDMAALLLQAPRAMHRVVVLSNPSDALLDDIRTLVTADYLQVHGVDAARAAMISERTHLPLILGVAMRGPDDLARAHALEPLAEYLLLDAPESGSGHAFDWSMLAGVRFAKPWFLAGGLTPANVADAIRLTHAPMVDVSSGIEARPGVKSAEKIAAFNRAVLDASHG